MCTGIVGKIAMSDRQYKAQLRRLRRHKKRTGKHTSTSGSGKSKQKKSGLKHRFSESDGEKRKELLRGKL